MSPGRVSEAAPVQVYLDRTTRNRLDWLVGHLGSNKSDVLRRGLLALERELSDPGAHPALRLAAGTTTGAETAKDVARHHDAYLSALHEPSPPPYGGRSRKKR